MFTKRDYRAGPAVGARRIGLGACVLASSLVCASLVGSTLPVDSSAAERSVPAERLTAADRQAIERTIRQQLDAFGRDDAEQAFAIAAPDIQRLFGSSDAFMRMVRDHYEPVYRSSGARFERLTLSDGQWVQAVRLTDDEGKVWRALFTMRRQADRAWKVGGCQLLETSALAI